MSKRYEWINGETYCDSDQMYDNETGNKTQPVYVADLLNKQDQKIKDLEHRLSNCIEPKFKQGDKCYGIIDTFAYTDVFPVEIRNTHLLYEVWDGEDTTKQHSTRIFATEEEAKAKLREIQDGK